MALDRTSLLQHLDQAALKSAARAIGCPAPVTPITSLAELEQWAKEKNIDHGDLLLMICPFLKKGTPQIRRRLAQTMKLAGVNLTPAEMYI